SWRWPRCRPAEMLSSWCSTIPGRLISVAGPAPWEVRAPARTLLAVASVLSGGNAVELVLDNPRGAISDPGTCPLGGSSTSSYLAGGGLGVVRGNAVELVLDNPREVDQRRRSSLLGGSSTSSYLAGGGISVVRQKTLSSWRSTIPGGRPGLTSQGVAALSSCCPKPALLSQINQASNCSRSAGVIGTGRLVAGSITTITLQALTCTASLCRAQVVNRKELLPIRLIPAASATGDQPA